jgi:hypothetical protein
VDDVFSPSIEQLRGAVFIGAEIFCLITIMNEQAF